MKRKVKGGKRKFAISFLQKAWLPTPHLVVLSLQTRVQVQTLNKNKVSIKSQGKRKPILRDSFPFDLWEAICCCLVKSQIVNITLALRRKKRKENIYLVNNWKSITTEYLCYAYDKGLKYT